MIPVFKVSANQLWLTVAMTVLFFGTAHLLAFSKPSNRFAQAWIGLGF